MDGSGVLRAWVKARGQDAFEAAFIGISTVDVANAALHPRPPATRILPTQQEARAWIEGEAGALGLPVEWVATPTQA